MSRAAAGDEGFTVTAIESALASQGAAIAGGGYQSSVYELRIAGQRYMVKQAAGGVLGWLHRLMLRREARAYRHAQGIRGIPRFYGLAGGRYLVLEYIDGVTLHEKRSFDDPEAFFTGLRETIERMHARGLAHGDMKKRENVMIDRDGRACLIDFGVATIRREGFHPLNHYVYETLRQFDINALHKHIYRAGEGQLIPAAEQVRFGKSRIETWSRALRPWYARLRGLFSRRD